MSRRLPAHHAVLAVLAALLALPAPAAGADPFARLPERPEAGPPAGVRGLGAVGYATGPGQRGRYIAPGARIRVPVSRTPRQGPVTIRVVRIARDGTPLARVATRRLRRGSFTATIPSARGRLYELRAGAARAVLYVPRGGAATLTLGRSAARAGETIATRLANTGDVPLITGAAYAIQRPGAQGWETVPLALVFPAIAYRLDVGARREDGFVVDPSLTPGRYRIVWNVAEDAVEGRRREVLAAAEFDVIP